MTLYEIDQAYIDWRAKVEEQEGELTDELMIELEGLTKDFDTKAETLAVFVKDLRADAEKLKAEKVKIEARQRSRGNLADRLAARLEESMKLHGRTKYSSPRCQVSFRSSSAVKITDEAVLPEEFWKTTKEPIKSAISEAIKAGTAVPGAEIEKTESIWVR